MKNDPIVEEIHKVREDISKECDYDLSLIIERLRRNEKNRLDAERKAANSSKVKESQ